MKIRPAQAATYFFAFTLPALSLGLLLLMVTASDLMIRPIPAPLKLAPAPYPAASSSASGLTAKKAWIVAGNGGVQISELLIAYEILAESGVFHVDLIAPQRVLSPTTSDVSFMPTATWREKSDAREVPDLLVIPSALDPGQSEVVTSLRALGTPSSRHPMPVIAVLSEGARLASEAGLMAGHKATSHFLALRDLKKSHPETHWLRDTRAVVDGRLVSSSSVSAAPVALLAALEIAATPMVAEKTARRLGYLSARPLARPELFPEGTTPGEFVQLILHGGYDFYKRETAVWLAPGVHESGLAAALDVLPRTFGAHVYSVARARDWTLTRHGLPLIAGQGLLPEPSRPVETLLIPAGAPAGALETLEPLLAAWMKSYTPTIQDLRGVMPGQALASAVEVSTRLEGAAMTAYAAKMLGAPLEQTRDAGTERGMGRSPIMAALLLAGALGVWLVWTFRRWTARLAAAHSGTVSSA